MSCPSPWYTWLECTCQQRHNSDQDLSSHSCYNMSPPSCKWVQRSSFCSNVTLRMVNWTRTAILILLSQHPKDIPGFKLINVQTNQLRGLIPQVKPKFSIRWPENQTPDKNVRTSTTEAACHIRPSKINTSGKRQDCRTCLSFLNHGQGWRNICLCCLNKEMGDNNLTLEAGP